MEKYRGEESSRRGGKETIHQEKKESGYEVRILDNYIVPKYLYGIHSVEEIRERVLVCELKNFKVSESLLPQRINENPCVMMMPNNEDILYFGNCSENRIYLDSYEIELDDKIKEEYEKATGETINKERIVFYIFYAVTKDGDFCFYVENNFNPAYIFPNFPEKLYDLLKKNDKIPSELVDKIDKKIKGENIIFSLPKQMVSSLFEEMRSKRNELYKSERS